MIYIIQCLCPQRHAILAIAYDPKDTPHDTAMTDFRYAINELIRRTTIDPWCGICGSRDWTYEQRRTKYKTMKEAVPDMRRLEQEQMEARAQIDRLRGSRN